VLGAQFRRHLSFHVLSIVTIIVLGCTEPGTNEREPPSFILRSGTSQLELAIASCMRNLTAQGSLDSVRGNLLAKGPKGDAVERDDTTLVLNIQRMAEQLMNQRVRAHTVNVGDVHLVRLERGSAGWAIEFAINAEVLGSLNLTFDHVSQSQMNDVTQTVQAWNKSCDANTIDRRGHSTK